MDLDDLLAAAARAGTLFGRFAVWVWLLFPHPREAVPRDLMAGRTKVADAYRAVWRTGQVIGWTCVASLVACVVWLVYLG